MPEPLLQVIYFSHENQVFTQTDLEGLLSQSRLKNARLNVTGVLVYSAPYFFQLIEGPQDTLLRLYQAIENDKRHRIAFAHKRVIELRTFSDWIMLFENSGVKELTHLMQVHRLSETFGVKDIFQYIEPLISFHQNRLTGICSFGDFA